MTIQDSDLISDPLLAPVRAQLLEAMVPLVPFGGWTLPVLRQAGIEAGIDRATQDRALPRGVIDLIDLLSLRADDTMATYLASLDLPAMKVRERITTAVRARLAAMVADKAAHRLAMQALGTPTRGATAARLAGRTVDRIWRETGDTSTDVNYYTKRLTLLGVYTSTALVFFDDDNSEHATTWAFLDRRIADVMRFEKVKAQAKKGFARIPSPLGVLSALRYPGGGKASG